MSGGEPVQDDFLDRYRAFVRALIKRSNADVQGAPPPWAEALRLSPFRFPPSLASDGTLTDLVAVLAELAAEQYSADAARDALMVLIGSTFFQSDAGASGIPRRRTTRGVARGTVSAPNAAAPPVAAAPTGAPPVAPPPIDAAPIAAAPLPAGADVPDTHTDAPTRYLNAGLKNYDAAQPLEVEEVYSLQFDVDVVQKGEASASIAALESALFAGDTQAVELTIQVASNDFDITPAVRTVTLPRAGASSNIGKFGVSPKHAGRCVLTATVSTSGNYLMTMELSYSVGKTNALPATSVVTGRAIDAALGLGSRDLSLIIKPVEKGYECTLVGATVTQVTLSMQLADVMDAIASARASMMDVVTFADRTNAKVFQKGLDIDATSNAAALQIMAFAGEKLFSRLFFNNDSGDDVQNFGTWLKTRLAAPGPPLRLQIVADKFPMPWGMLYVGETAGGAALSWDNFVGMRHVIEVMPRQAKILVNDATIASDAPSLGVSVTVNAGIDKQMNLSVVSDQLKYWSDRGAAPNVGVAVTQLQTKADFLSSLRLQANEQLMYMYCHAITNGPNDVGGIRGSRLVLSNDESVTLDDLNREAPVMKTLPGNPLVFLNACESAELSPAFYDGFVPYFMAKGARGVIGTECKTPAIFATHFALKFFPRFLAGEPIGDLFLSLRREFAEQHGNPLGLLYAVYCDGDTKIHPGLSH